MVNLPKWPAFHVKGDTVSKETAMDFILRTDSSIHSYISGNNMQYKNWFLERMGWNRFEKFMDDNDLDMYHRFHLENEFREIIGVVDLGDIPSDNICTAFVYGPHGFIDANGLVHHMYNIGKWPNANDVENHLRKIVETWGVKFKSTLYDDEHCNLTNQNAVKNALITFVSDGHTLETITNPDSMEDICYVGALSEEESTAKLMKTLTGSGIEKGVTQEELEAYIFPKTNEAIDSIIESCKIEGK